MAKDNAPIYSVVILTFNRAGLLPSALKSVTQQTVAPDKYEILIIDDGSTDDTEKTAQNFIGEHAGHNIKYFKIPHGGEARGRNEGVKRARGEYIFFADDDCIVPPNWIEHFSRIYERHPEIVGVGGWKAAPPRQLASNRIVRYVYLMFFGYKNLDTIPRYSSSYFFNSSGNTANMSYKRWALLKIGGFDEGQNFSGAVDFELKRRVFNMGWKLYYTPLFAFHINNPTTVSGLFRESVRRGRGLRFIAEKFPDLMRINYGLPSVRASLSHLNNLSERIFSATAALYFIDTVGRYIGWHYARFFGPHPGNWSKCLSVKKQNRKAVSRNAA